MRATTWALLTIAALATVTDAGLLRPGDLVVVDPVRDELLRIDPHTGAKTVLSSGGDLYAAHSVSFDSNGMAVIVNDWDAPTRRGSIVRVNPDTGAQTRLFYGADSDDPWTGIVTVNNDILFTDYGNWYSGGSLGGRIRKYSAATGQVTTVAQNTVLKQTLNHVLAGDTIYLSDRYIVNSGSPVITASRIVRHSLTTGVSAAVSSGGLLNENYGLAFDPASGMLYVANRALGAGQGSVLRVDPATGAQTVLSVGGLLVKPSSITFDHAGRLLVGDYNGGDARIVAVDPVSGSQSLVADVGGYGAWGLTAVAPEPACLAALAGAVCIRRRR